MLRIESYDKRKTTKKWKTSNFLPYFRVFSTFFPRDTYIQGSRLWIWLCLKFWKCFEFIFHFLALEYRPLINLHLRFLSTNWYQYSQPLWFPNWEKYPATSNKSFWYLLCGPEINVIILSYIVLKCFTFCAWAYFCSSVCRKTSAVQWKYKSTVESRFKKYLNLQIHLGTIHILRNHLFRIFGPPSPYVIMFLVLKIIKNWHFLTPLPPYKWLRNIWMVPYLGCCTERGKHTVYIIGL